jgi:hypothetical protein
LLQHHKIWRFPSRVRSEYVMNVMEEERFVVQIVEAMAN